MLFLYINYIHIAGKNKGENQEKLKKMRFFNAGHLRRQTCPAASGRQSRKQILPGFSCRRSFQRCENIRHSNVKGENLIF